MIALDWVEGKGVYPLIRSIERRIGPRQKRLLAVAFCDRIVYVLQQDICRDWIDVARRYADKVVRRPELATAHAAAQATYVRFGQPTTWRGLSIQNALHAVESALHPTLFNYTRLVAASAANATAYAASDRAEPLASGADPVAYAAESTVQLHFLRDVLGRPDDIPQPEVETWLAWHGGLVPKLARGIYDDQAFDRMPVLGDALEDAGCADAAMLAHCRGSGPHTRGCWVVDMLLGKG